MAASWTTLARIAKVATWMPGSLGEARRTAGWRMIVLSKPVTTGSRKIVRIETSRPGTIDWQTIGKIGWSMLARIGSTTLATTGWWTLERTGSPSFAGVGR